MKAILVASTLLMMGCGRSESADADASIHRDSAGVDIVTNTRPAWAPGDGWKVDARPFVVIRNDEAGSDRSPLDPVTVHRAANGEVIVADGAGGGLHKLLVFDSKGAFLRSVGRPGKGPCEFQQLTWAEPYRGDSIAVYDYATHAVTVFDVAGKCGRTFRLPRSSPKTPPGTYAFSEGADGAFEDGSILSYPNGSVNLASADEPRWYEHTLVRVAPDGRRADTLGTFRLMQINWTKGQQRERPYTAVAIKRVSGSDLLYASGDVFQYARYDGSGKLKQIVRRDQLPRSITEQERSSYIDVITERVTTAAFEGGPEAATRRRVSLQTIEWPTHAPSIGSLLVDARGYVWVGEYVNPQMITQRPDSSRVTWHVFRPDGQWLGPVPMPVRFSPTRIYDDAIFGLWHADDDVKEVRAFRLTSGSQ